MEQVKTNDLLDRRFVIKNPEGVQIYQFIRAPINEISQTFEASLFNMNGQVSYAISIFRLFIFYKTL